MARFYGTVQGGRGMASRLGHATSGLQVEAKSYQGDIEITLQAKDEIDVVTIQAKPHGWGAGITLYHGPVADLLKESARIRFLQQAVGQALLEDAA